eukprot:173574_1
MSFTNYLTETCTFGYQIVNGATATVGLTISLLVTFNGFKSLFFEKKEESSSLYISTRFKVTFALCCIASLLLCAIEPTFHVLICDELYKIISIPLNLRASLYGILGLCYLSILINLQTTLIMRLNDAFKETIWQLTNTQYGSLVIASIFFLITAIISIALLVYQYFYVNQFVINLTMLFVMGSTLGYFITSWICVSMFVRRLMALLIEINDDRNNYDHENEELKSQKRGSILDERQQILANQISKYILLECFALCSTFITNIIGALIIPGLTTVIDAIFNIVCLLLQYRFAQMYYNSICIGCHGLFKYCVEKRATAKIDTVMATRLQLDVNNTDQNKSYSSDDNEQQALYRD